jgi:hypothetical protein
MPATIRAGILLWSTVSGVILGAFTGAVLGAVLMLVGAVLPDRWLSARARIAALVLCCALPAILGAVLGFLEGQLKAS